MQRLPPGLQIQVPARKVGHGQRINLLPFRLLGSFSWQRKNQFNVPREDDEAFFLKREPFRCSQGFDKGRFPFHLPFFGTALG